LTSFAVARRLLIRKYMTPLAFLILVSGRDRGGQWGAAAVRHRRAPVDYLGGMI
jgi:hypothetical protein